MISNHHARVIVYAPGATTTLRPGQTDISKINMIPSILQLTSWLWRDR